MSERQEQIDSRLAEIPGQYHAKRALEVALEGGHSIQFIGSAKSQAESLLDALEDLSPTWPFSQAVMPCPCGYYGTANGTSTVCTCSAEQIAEWRQENGFNDNGYAISVVIPDDNPEEVLKLVDTEGFDETAIHLLGGAVRQLGLSFKQASWAIEVAQTISRMAGAGSVQACHLAEAIQYTER